ncbi:hypothetical protein C4K68_21935 [Pokkaliibacter plantistimulans]|uniref:Amine oxidase domain-containing protein n=1 Tax=Proteobacteria bacterium 228 TaxID=2083153 RepID=A0A2S5KKY0_9PROT|nr:NAD(P)-binding protein [Pokkaliibacter plantistimulans]PPC75295.1 hypothetical protein C4K68_21935 [Pokkaliibacter plantistimulans]
MVIPSPSESINPTGSNSPVSKKRKIVILGGGVSAITAAFKLTSEANWQEKYDINLYQMGWLLGGKGASGRNANDHERIEEHGIHVWFGFYYNAFHYMRACYQELGRSPDQPLATLDDAFKPHHTTAFAQKFNNQWCAWPIKTFALPGIVGDGWNPKPLMTALAMLVAWILNHTGGAQQLDDSEPPALPLFQRLEDDMLDMLDKEALADINARLQQAQKTLPTLEGLDTGEPHAALIELLTGVRTALRDLTAPFLHLSVKVSRLWMMADFGLTGLIGILADELYHYGLNAANDINLRDWLEQHGASRITLEGPIMASLYGGVFAYKDGLLDQPNVETGTVIRAGLNALSCSKQSFIWRMQAGMGDTVFGPYYEVLKRRGVQFKFFHRVEEVVAASDDQGGYISQIRLAQQVPLKDPSKEYEPLVMVKGLPCWPSEPLYDQIDDAVAAKLQANHINLNSFWSNWPEIYDEPQVVLKQGDDFDEVILGISVASLPSLCPTLMAANPAFATMTGKISTVATQAMQLWLNQDVEQLGWINYQPDEEAPEILGFDAQAMDSWADVSYLVARETWPVTDEPKDISYFCGVFNPDAPPPAPNVAYVQSQADKVKAQCITMMNTTLGSLWKNATDADGFKWQYLIAPDSLEGQARFDAQYWRANIDPSERYVQSTVSSSQYRLKTDESGFRNLYLTGDWIRNGFNMGCVESATISGLLTARAVSGSSEQIPGEGLFE